MMREISTETLFLHNQIYPTHMHIFNVWNAVCEVLQRSDFLHMQKLRSFKELVRKFGEIWEKSAKQLIFTFCQTMNKLEICTKLKALLENLPKTPEAYIVGLMISNHL